MVFVNGLNRAITLVAGIALVAMVLHIGANVAARHLFNQPIHGTLEFVMYYYMVVVTVLPLSLAQVAREHVIVEVFTQGLRPRLRKGLDIFAGALTSVYLAVLVWACAEGAVSAFLEREYQDLYFFTIPIWPSRWVLLAGIVAIMVTVLVQLASDEYSGERTDDTPWSS